MSLARPVVVTVLLIVAVIGLRAWVGASLTSRGPLEPYIGATLQTVAVVVIAAAAGVGTFLTVLNARRRERRGTEEVEGDARPVPRWLRLVILLTALALVGLVVVIIVALRTHGALDGAQGASPRRPTPVTPHASGAGSVIAAASPYAIVVAVVLGLLLGLYVARRRGLVPSSFALLPEQSTDSAELPPLATAVSAGRLAVERPDDDPRSAIIACYAAMERALADAGSPRRPSDTPDELLARATASGAVPSPAARVLTSLFHEARFSRHPLDESDRRMAVAALDEISRDLGEARATQGTT